MTCFIIVLLLSSQKNEILFKFGTQIVVLTMHKFQPFFSLLYFVIFWVCLEALFLLHITISICFEALLCHFILLACLDFPLHRVLFLACSEFLCRVIFIRLGSCRSCRLFWFCIGFVLAMV